MATRRHCFAVPTMRRIRGSPAPGRPENPVLLYLWLPCRDVAVIDLTWGKFGRLLFWIRLISGMGGSSRAFQHPYISGI